MAAFAFDLRLIEMGIGLAVCTEYEAFVLAGTFFAHFLAGNFGFLVHGVMCHFVFVVVGCVATSL